MDTDTSGYSKPVKHSSDQFRALSASRNAAYTPTADLSPAQKFALGQTTAPHVPTPIITADATSDPVLADTMRRAAMSKSQRVQMGSMIPSDADYEVKSWPAFFSKMITYQKKHDMRKKSDRDYRIGDKVLLREYDPFGGGYTGREAIFEITYITSNDTPCALSSNALDKDAVILSLDMVSHLFLTGKAATAVQ